MNYNLKVIIILFSTLCIRSIIIPKELHNHCFPNVFCTRGEVPTQNFVVHHEGKVLILRFLKMQTELC